MSRTRPTSRPTSPRTTELLQHVPDGLRLHRPLRRHVHHLQHLLDRRRPAGQGPRHAPGHRRPQQPGAPLGDARVGRWSASSPPPSASSPASGCPSACGRCSAPSGSTSPTAPWSSAPAPSSRPSRSAWSPASCRPSCRPSGPAGCSRSPRCATWRSTAPACRSGGSSPASPSPALGVVGFAAGVTADGKDALPLLGLGAVVIILGVFVLGPVLVRPAIKVLGAPVAARGRHGQLRPGERPPHAQAHRGHGVGPDDRCRPRGVHHDHGRPRPARRSSRRSTGRSAPTTSSTRAPGTAASPPRSRTTSPASRRSTRCRRCGPASPSIDGATTNLLAVDTTTFDGLYDLEVSAGSLTDVTGDERGGHRGSGARRGPGHR